ncbi:hypothetical protein QYM36_014247 [Artemia franciscana]|uniref:Uncharacterized protein n=1 Tax=Artemia franciscana TaxID=6661 RepID=A0AA88HN36_ARTSF|nr:hypothetical protein QYM36_014247 [Artemia franciscana]
MTSWNILSKVLHRQLVPSLTIVRYGHRKPNVKRPAVPSWERACMDAVTNPIFPEVITTKIPPWVKSCKDLARVTVEPEPENKYEQLLIKDVKKLLSTKKMVIVCQENSKNSYQKLDAKILLYENGMAFDTRGSNIYRKATAGTELEQCHVLFQGFTCLVHADSAENIRTFMKIEKKIPFIIALGGILDGRIVNRDELSWYASLPGIEGLHGELVSILGSFASTYDMAETLRILTYMCPSHPVELYQTIVEYLESKLNKPCELLYEWRGSGPESGVPDPFKSTSAGIAFISSFSFQHLSATDDPDWTLLPVGAVCQHPKKGDGLGYWSDLIISSADKERIKELIDLRGCRLARPEVSSLSGYIALLKAVRDHGESAAFFGNVLDSGSHLASIEMVSLKQAELAAVDSLALQNALDQHPAMRSEIHILDTLGPLPPHPIVVRATMDGKVYNIRNAICLNWNLASISAQ